MPGRPLALLGALGALGAGCSLHLNETVHGSGAPTSEIRSEGASFTTLVVEGPIECVVEVGGATTWVSVHGDDNLLEYLETIVDDGVLLVRIAPGIRLEPTPRVEVLVPDLARVDLEGSGAVRVAGVTGERFECNLAGSGELSASGRVEVLTVERDGSGDLDLTELVAEEALVDSDGSGYVYVHATRELEVDLSGSGRVVYRGTPNVSARTRGSGDVRALTAR